MSFFKTTPEFDLGELNVENIFITDFMPSASGTYVKVYLLGLMFSKAEHSQYHYDNRTLANMLSIPLQDVFEAWNYWEKCGVIHKHLHENSQDYDVEFLSLRALYIQNNYVQKHLATSTKKALSKATENPFKLENERFQSLIKSVEQIVGHPLTYSEHREVSDFYEHYSKDANYIMKAFTHCYQDRGIRNFKIVKSTLTNWLDRGLMTVSAVEKHLISYEERNLIYKEILSRLGVSYRLANQGEKELMDKWLDQFLFKPQDLYEIIGELSKKTLTISFNYIDKALTKLNTMSINTFSGYQSTQNKEKVEAKPQERSKRKTYTVEKDKTYSEEELEQLLLNKNRK